MGKDIKHIDVTESTWKKLWAIRKPGESFDDVISDLIDMAADPDKIPYELKDLKRIDGVERF